MDYQRGQGVMTSQGGADQRPGQNINLRDNKSKDGKAVLPLPDMTASPMELRYPNDHLEDHEGDWHIARPDNSIEITDHA